MNLVFLGIVCVAFVVGGATGSMGEVSQAAFSSAKASVDLAIGLIGYMALFLGLLKVGEKGGLLRLLARAIRPLMVRLFPDVPPDHPAMGAMILNIAANMSGLGNAATPLGIKAMHELNKLNTRPGVATNAMVLFLAINTSGVALLPSGVVSVRAALDSQDPWGIVAPSLVATLFSTVVGISMAKFLCRLKFFAPPDAVEGVEVAEVKEPEVDAADAAAAAGSDQVTWGVYVLGAFLLTAVALLAGPTIGAAILGSQHPDAQGLRDFQSTVADWIIPVMIVGLLGFGQAKGVKVYEAFVEGAKEGFEIAVRIIPYLVAILVAVGMFRASGAMDFVTGNVGVLTALIGLPGEALPMALVRPLSGSGAFGIMAEIMEANGPDSYTGYVVSVLNGSTETTFYVLAVYFGSVGVSRVRHAVAAGLSADIAGVIATGLACSFFFGHLT